MTEVFFYHLQSRPLEAALPQLLEKCVERGWRCTVQATSPEQIEALDQLLWTYDEASFLPHGTDRQPDSGRQPILLTASESRSERGDGAILHRQRLGAGPVSLRARDSFVRRQRFRSARTCPDGLAGGTRRGPRGGVLAAGAGRALAAALNRAGWRQPPPQSAMGRKRALALSLDSPRFSATLLSSGRSARRGVKIVSQWQHFVAEWAKRALSGHFRFAPPGCFEQYHRGCRALRRVLTSENPTLVQFGGE